MALSTRGHQYRYLKPLLGYAQQGLQDVAFLGLLGHDGLDI